MFYAFRDEFVSIEKDNICANDLVLGYIRLDEINSVQSIFSLPPRCVDRCRSENSFFHFDVEKTDSCIFARLKIINPTPDSIDSDSIAVFIKKNLLLIVDIEDTDGSIRDNFFYTKNRFSDCDISIEMLVFAFIEGAVSGDNLFIEQTLDEIEQLEKSVLDENTDDSFNYKLLTCKQTLMYMHNYYEQLLDIIQALTDWYEDIFDERELQYFRSIKEKIKRLIDNINLLRDSVIHLRDAYNSSLEMSLNKTMKIFTVFTVFFSPLTLISGWYGMNFVSMGELGWKYGYAIPVVLSVAVVVVLYFWFHHKKWI